MSKKTPIEALSETSSFNIFKGLYYWYLQQPDSFFRSRIDSSYDFGLLIELLESEGFKITYTGKTGYTMEKQKWLKKA